MQASTMRVARRCRFQFSAQFAGGRAPEKLLSLLRCTICMQKCGLFVSWDIQLLGVLWSRFDGRLWWNECPHFWSRWIIRWLFFVHIMWIWRLSDVPIPMYGHWSFDVVHPIDCRRVGSIGLFNRYISLSSLVHLCSVCMCFQSPNYMNPTVFWLCFALWPCFMFLNTHSVFDLNSWTS